jgi:ribonucleotide reductase alpha subunit
MWNNEWKKGEDYPKWGDTEVYKKTISGGYLLQDETPRDAYMRVAKTVARRLYKPEMADTFFEYIWNGWLCLASLTAAFLLAALALTLLIRYRI